METQNHVTKINQRVRLKPDGQDALYHKACAGSEGWVRKQDKDEGYPMVYIEWDKDHWAYNGEPDRWAIEAHFDPIEETSMAEPNVTPEDFANFQAFMAWQQQQKAEAPPAEEAKEETPDIDVQFAQACEIAAESTKNSDAFILIGIDREESPDKPRPKLTPFVLTASKHAESGLLAELQLSNLANVAFETLTVDAIHRIFGEDSE